MTSLAFEMEALILGWYVLTATGSVQYLVAFAALAWVGSLFSPFFGILGDRIGLRRLLCATRGTYALLELGANPHLKMKDGSTALSHAMKATNSSPELIEMIQAALARTPAPKPKAGAAARKPSARP